MLLLGSFGVIIGVLAAVIGIVGVMVAVIVVMNNIKKQKNSPIISVEAKFLGAKAESRIVNQNFSSGTVDSYNGYHVTTNYIEFKPKQGKKISFKVKSKIAIKYNDGDTGILTYQGYKFVDFLVKEPSFSSKTQAVEKGKTVLFYGEAEGLDLSVSSKGRINYTFTDLEKLYEKLPQDNSDWFFVLKRDDGAELMVERHGNTDVLCTKNIRQEETKSIISYDQLLKFIKQYFDKAL